MDVTIGRGIVRHISLRLAEVSDADFIFKLRTDSAKSRHLSAIGESVESQRQWLEEYKIREQDGLEYYWIIVDADERRIGLVRMYDFKEGSFCWGSWILDNTAPTYASIESALAIYEIGFYKLRFKQAHFDVRKENVRVVDFHIRFGAVKVDEDVLNYYFVYPQSAFEKIRGRYRKFFAEGEYP